MNHFQCMVDAPYLAPAAQAHALFQAGLLRPGEMKEPEGYGPGTVADAAQQAPAPSCRHLDQFDRPLAQGAVAGPQAADGNKPGPVDIPMGKVKQQVLNLADSQVLQAFTGARTNTFQGADGCAKRREFVLFEIYLLLILDT